ncbi:SusC/RagA family TonB-linked outer membrane protein [Chitinophagaceae bacterium LB-8]|uniref:SusC/RagA family TonB-linked outer membrane protein n=1 Tax=Paraflavisolibacter caeni TaxID=2982496 RepID=A0A9X2XZP1_9BACT|nr:SusC/RagA family TonB-linked outer membrane protein [Paraflavisolibacter caeni]MCU7552589.1 SusC/RagA family TonB-linked outer membrane protein [Paraflavisolibacter caeni]
MNLLRLLQVKWLFIAILCSSQMVLAQNKLVSGKVTDTKDNSAIPGVSISVKGTNIGTTTGTEGNFTLSVPENAKTLIFTAVGYGTKEEPITGNTFNISLATSASNLNEIVVVGYGTVRRKDITGSVATVNAKNFNKGVQTAPDQLIQGKVAGVQVVNNSGAPGGATTVRIRGTASVRAGGQPLYVVDGVPLDGRTARPDLKLPTISNTPNANPLNFINTNDVASIDVLKDASATAIYGSRGANGVVIITTKKGQSGAPKLDVSVSGGVSNIMNNYDVLNASEYRKALADFNAPASNDFGGDVDAMDAILRTAYTQNYNISMGGGTENGRYRISAGYLNQQGIVEKSSFKKYTVNLNSQFKFLESKKLGLDLNVISSHNTEQIAPVTNNAGFEGSLIGQALFWNPTLPLRKANDSLNILQGTTVNPLAMSEAYDDISNITNILASISPYYKLTKNLEYRLLYSINHGVGVRRSEIASFINIPDIQGKGYAFQGNNELTTQQLTQTLNFVRAISDEFHLTALLGYEYQKFDNKGASMEGKGFLTDAIDYTNYIQNSDPTSRVIKSFADPISELQSFFARAVGNYRDKYVLTATFRADGSSKFGENNRYGYFPSFAAAWNIKNESFMQGGAFSNLKLRLGWGQTGNQEFPAGASQERYKFDPGTFSQENVANPDLKWEKSTTENIGVDFGVFKDRLSGSIDYFRKKTTDLLFQFDAIQPAPATKYWINLPGEVINSGVEVSLNGVLMSEKDINWNLGVNASFLDNELKNYNGPTVLTGDISGQGASGSRVQRLENGHPLNAFYVREFLGIDKTTGFSTYTDNGNTSFFIGDPNPDVLLGISTDFSYKKFTVTVNMNGAFGHDIYNNTLNTVLPIGNLQGGRNIAASLANSEPKESLSNSVFTSSRYLEKGNYMKLANATLSYNFGNLGKEFRNVNVYITGQNLFVLTNYNGFDPEVNTDKNVDDVPSFGIEYIPYPPARTITLGVNFSL